MTIPDENPYPADGMPEQFAAHMAYNAGYDAAHREIVARLRREAARCWDELCPDQVRSDGFMAAARYIERQGRER